MNVQLILGTKNDPGAKVEVTASIRFTNTESFDRWLAAQKIARDWLNKELARK